MGDYVSWIDRFQGLMTLDAETRAVLTRNSRVISVSESTVVFGPGNAPENLLLLLEGTIRVQQMSEQGREIVLYRANAGESCVLTTACLLAHETYTAEGIAETDVSAAAIPKQAFDDLIAQSAPFREFVFAAYSRRIMDLFHVIDEVAFQRMDVRMAEKIITRQDAQGQIRATHQQMAAELGTAREVVSRTLSEFQRREWVSLARGVITIRNEAALRKLSKDV